MVVKQHDYYKVVVSDDYNMVVNECDYHKVVAKECAVKLQGEIRSPQELGAILQQGRLLAGESQRALAEKLGVTQRYLWEIESGKDSLYLQRLFAALRATGVRLIAEIETDETKNDG